MSLGCFELVLSLEARGARLRAQQTLLIVHCCCSRFNRGIVAAMIIRRAGP